MVEFTERISYSYYRQKPDDEESVFDPPFGKEYGYGKSAVLECADIEVLKNSLKGAQ